MNYNRTDKLLLNNKSRSISKEGKMKRRNSFTLFYNDD